MCRHEQHAPSSKPGGCRLRAHQVCDLLEGAALEVTEDAAQHGLVADDEAPAAVALEALQHRPRPPAEVDVRLAAGVAVPQLVLLAAVVHVRHVGLDVRVRRAVAHPRVDLVKLAQVHLHSRHT